MHLLKIFAFLAASLPVLAFANVQVLGFEIGVSTAKQGKALTCGRATSEATPIRDLPC